MSEQRPNVPGQPGDDRAGGGEEPTLEWFADLKDDADDPELHAVNPSVTQAFGAIVDEKAGKDEEPLFGEPEGAPAEAGNRPEAPAEQRPQQPAPGEQQPWRQPTESGQPWQQQPTEAEQAWAPQPGQSEQGWPQQPAEGEQPWQQPGQPEQGWQQAPAEGEQAWQPVPVEGAPGWPQTPAAAERQAQIPVVEQPALPADQALPSAPPSAVQPTADPAAPAEGPSPDFVRALAAEGTSGPFPVDPQAPEGEQRAATGNTGPLPAVGNQTRNTPGAPVPVLPADFTAEIEAPPAPAPAVPVPARQPDPGTDTVAVAARTPDRPQPFAELGMKDDEYRRVRDILGRRPTAAELAIYSVMWSEHCSYKSSKVHLRQFGDKAPKTDALLVGMGENAGVVDVGHGWAVTFKVESHNHPSYVEPYQGAATGVGGIVRDIMSMGARPIAVMDSLRFGPADAPDTQRVMPGVVAGVGGYGNSLGLPNIGGETVFDACYAQNPLVNALCVGVMKHEDIKRAVAPGPGNKVILFGAGTGPDGIGGASVLASATFDDESQAKRPSVQVGDPFMEKLLIECCLELFREDLVVGIQDLGAAGVSCATTELAAAGTGGMTVELDAVPLRDATLRPEEILMSESQERMMAVVSPDKVARFMEICGRWEIPATVIGEVTDTGRLVMTWRGETIVDIPPGTAADEGPVYERPYAPPADLGALQSDTPGRLTRPSNGDELRRTVLWLAGSPNLAAKTWVTSQYDRYVLGNTVLAMPEDAGVVRIDDESGLGIALSLDGNGRYARLDPYAGAQLALSEAYRNVAATGARPLAVTNCLNFGSPEDPGVMWQFAQAVTGLADACQYLGIPVTGGNVSFYNQTGTTPINPTPVIGVLGVHEDVRRRVNMSLTSEGATLALLGETREEFGGSEWAHVVYNHLGGLPPKVDLAAERALASVLIAAAREGLLTATHDLSDGGLSQTLVESCLRGGLGARITLPGDPFTALFSESVARAMVAIRPGGEGRVAALCQEAGVPVAQLGVAGGDALTVSGRGGEGDQQELFSIPLAELRESHERTLPSYAS